MPDVHFAPDPPAVDPLEAHALAQAGGMLLDVREVHEWRGGHAPGALHVPLGQLPEAVKALPVDRPIVAVCRSGQRSAAATAALRQAGYDVVNLTGGMQAWAAHGLSVVRDDEQPGTVL